MFGLAKKLVSSIETQATSYLNNRDSPKSEDLDVGLRILYVGKGSIAEKVGFESWFDFITAINGRPILSFFRQGMALNGNPYSSAVNNDSMNVDSHQLEMLHLDSSNIEYSLLWEFILAEVNNRQQDLIFTVWSAKGGVTRQIHISRIDVTITSESIQIGMGLQLELQLSALSAASYVWHVLHVQKGSPADLAGIQPDEYVLNCEGGKLSTGGEDLFGRVVTATYNRWKLDQAKISSISEKPCSLELYIYNHDYDVVRPVVIYPTEKWGGKGLLGCDVGYGLLHRLPEVLGKFNAANSPVPNIAPGNVMFSQNSTSQPAASEPTPFQPPPLSTNVLKPTARAPLFNVSDSNSVPEPSAPPPRVRRKSRGTVNRRLSISDQKAKAAALEDYFKEETAKSQAIDPPSKSVKSDVPPPPMKRVN